MQGQRLMWEKHFSMQHKKNTTKNGSLYFLPTKKKDWIIPKKQKNKNARHNGPSTSGCLPHDFFKDLWLSIGSHGPSIVNLVTITESRGVEYDSSTVHQPT